MLHASEYMLCIHSKKEQNGVSFGQNSDAVTTATVWAPEPEPEPACIQI